MSEKSVSRKIQKQVGVAYSTALRWVRDPENRAAADVLKKADPNRPYSQCLVEVITTKYQERTG